MFRGRDRKPKKLQKDKQMIFHPDSLMLTLVFLLPTFPCFLTRGFLALQLNFLHSFHHNPVLPTFIFPLFFHFLFLAQEFLAVQIICSVLSIIIPWSNCYFPCVSQWFLAVQLNFYDLILRVFLIVKKFLASDRCKRFLADRYAEEIILPALILTCQYSASQEMGVFNEDFPSSLSLFHR